MERRDAASIVNAIETVLEKNGGKAISVSHIAKKTGLNYNSTKDYLKLIVYIKNEFPDIEEIPTDRGKIFMVKKMSEYNLEEQKEILKREYKMKIDDTDKLYIYLLKNSAITPSRAIRVMENRIISKGLKAGHLKKNKFGEIYLTEIGKMIAEGAKEIFS